MLRSLASPRSQDSSCTDLEIPNSPCLKGQYHQASLVCALLLLDEAHIGLDLEAVSILGSGTKLMPHQDFQFLTGQHKSLMPSCLPVYQCSALPVLKRNIDSRVLGFQSGPSGRSLGSLNLSDSITR